MITTLLVCISPVKGRTIFYVISNGGSIMKICCKFLLIYSILLLILCSIRSEISTTIVVAAVPPMAAAAAATAGAVQVSLRNLCKNLGFNLIYLKREIIEYFYCGFPLCVCKEFNYIFLEPEVRNYCRFR